MPLALSSQMRDKLQNADVDYLIALRLALFRVQTGSFLFGHAVISMPSMLFVYDVKTAREEYQEIFVMGAT